MIEIRFVETQDQLEAVRFLMLAHAAALREHPGSGDVRGDAERLPGPYAPPRGGLYLGLVDGLPAGCVALHPLDEETAEVKRMFVLASARRQGLARALMSRLLDDARALGYRRVRLGTLDDMTAAQQLYRQLGFTRIARYRADERVDTVFFERDLFPSPSTRRSP